ncbi:cell envelope integrity EipB family protein [Oryzibacter oryziterrae]|uniref:cell envelope integrity EipB family protein n=1 Tax=Oryzibacter oryziterrae TaxID=2766474 RepID=UPI001F287DF5|nr:cell envelope integrity EipB family protein [Oryzibacter oryziterrae]
MSSIVRAAAISMLLTAAAGQQAYAITLAPHRAVYDLALDTDKQIADGAVNMKGRMVYEFTGSTCEGYTVNFRFVIETQDASNGSTITDLRTSNHESTDDKDFQFLSQTYTNQVLTEDVKGSAERQDDTVAVSLNLPEKQDLKIVKEATFPTAHLLKIIDAAEKGEKVLNLEVYDGSDGGTHVYKTSTIIGDERKTPPDPNEAPIGNMRRWPVTVSYFNSTETGDLTPDYSISFDLWENGVSTKMKLDYGDFVLKGDIGQFEALPVTACTQ